MSAFAIKMEEMSLRQQGTVNGARLRCAPGLLVLESPGRCIMQEGAQLWDTVEAPCLGYVLGLIQGCRG